MIKFSLCYSHGYRDLEYGVIAIVTETHAQRREAALESVILKYFQPQLKMQFYLYVKDVHDPEYCIAISRVENSSFVDKELRPMGYEMVADSPAINGVFKKTKLKIDIEGGVVETDSSSPLELR